MKSEEIIRKTAEEWGMTYGIGGVRLFSELHPLLEQENGALQGFVEQDVEKRINPYLLLPTAKSLVVFALPYGKRAAPMPKGELRGRFSMGAVGKDYHLVFQEFFGELTQQLHKQGILAKGFADTAPLVDRFLAKEVGLGSLGKNRCIHVKELGSAVFLGYLLVDKQLEKTLPFLWDCGNCEKCITACPTGALGKDGFTVAKCISYLTQKKGVLSTEEMKTMGLQLYGCDVCQMVCPHNQKQHWQQMGEDSIPSLAGTLSLTNGAFREKYQGTACGWRGRKMLQRNAVIALGNTGNKEGLPLLAKALGDGSAMVRHTAVRSIANLGFWEGILLLREHRFQEEEDVVRSEMEAICRQWEEK